MSDVHGDVGSYVADALTADERATFEAHLAECDSCRRDVAELRETAAELAALSATTPPPALKTSVMWSIAAVRPRPPEESRISDPVAPLPPTDELAVRRQRRATRLLQFAVAAAVVVALALGGWTYALTVQQRTLVASAAQEIELLSAPDARIYDAEVNGQPVAFVVSKAQNQAMFVGADLAEPGSGRSYQLWTITPEEQAVPDELIPSGGMVRQWFREPVRDAAALAISNEQEAGATTPTQVLDIVELS